MKFEFSQQIFEKVLNIKFHQNPSIGSRVVPCGQTDTTKIVVVFRNFAKAPENAWSIASILLTYSCLQHRQTQILVSLISRNQRDTQFLSYEINVLITLASLVQLTQTAPQLKNKVMACCSIKFMQFLNKITDTNFENTVQVVACRGTMCCFLLRWLVYELTVYILQTLTFQLTSME